MAAVTSAVVVAGAAVAGAAQQKKAAKKQESAAKKAAAGQERAAIESAQFLQNQGRRGEAAIRAGAQEAASIAQRIPFEVSQPLNRIARIGGDAFSLAAGDILSGSPLSQSALSGRISNSALDASLGVAGGDTGDPVRAELERQAGMTGEAAGRQIGGGLFDLGRQGVLTSGDIAQIESRGAARLGDIATQQAAGRASALVGSAAPAATAIQGAGEARLLSDFATNRLKTQQTNQLATLAGQFLG